MTWAPRTTILGRFSYRAAARQRFLCVTDTPITPEGSGHSSCQLNFAPCRRKLALRRANRCLHGRLLYSTQSMAT